GQAGAQRDRKQADQDGCAGTGIHPGAPSLCRVVVVGACGASVTVPAGVVADLAGGAFVPPVAGGTAGAAGALVADAAGGGWAGVAGAAGALSAVSARLAARYCWRISCELGSR